jgi:hypothetical protein
LLALVHGLPTWVRSEVSPASGLQVIPEKSEANFWTGQQGRGGRSLGRRLIKLSFFYKYMYILNVLNIFLYKN